VFVFVEAFYQAPAVWSVYCIKAKASSLFQSSIYFVSWVYGQRNMITNCVVGSCSRAVTWGLAGAMLGLNVGDKGASAAARRPPAPAPEERKDPNVSGVQAKVLASKKRKEAMKQSMAKLKERGKPVNGPTE
jgi:hypothetical protein